MHTHRVGAAIVLAAITGHTIAGDVTIGDYTFDLNQFNSAAVTYRSDGSITFDGKLWDNEVGVDGVTIGELAAGQYGSDPGDQLSLNDASGTVDWFELGFSTGLVIGSGMNDNFVFYEITSSNSGVDVEGTSWEISFNGGSFISAGFGDATFLDNSSLGVENVNQIAFSLSSFGFSAGDVLNTIRVRNVYSGSTTSDPDFIFGGLGSTLTVVPLPPAAFAALGLMGGLVGIRNIRRR
ncbi:MAG: hypothetical protein ACX94C_09790 [Phycisphaerales bacterium]